MTFVTARDLRLHPVQIWQKLAKTGEAVITLKGRPIGILAKTSGDEVEEFLRAFRQARGAYAISRLREEATASGADKLTTTEIDQEIEAVRRTRAPASRRR